jgi:hypothetical protein
MPLEAKGALFQLWTIQQTPVVDYLLDQKLVGVFPSAVINITTEDPYTTVPRTRADRPFTVTIDVTGLVDPTSTLPDASKKVLLQQFSTAYPAGVTSFTQAAATAGTPVQGYILGNTTPGVNRTTLSYTKTSITSIVPSVAAPDPTKASGEQYFLVHALTNGTTPQTQIASKFIQIWPVADGKLTGIASGDKIRSLAPPVTVTLNSLYPRSDTWVQVYKGTPVLGTTGVTVPGSFLVLDQTKPDTRTLTLTNWDSVFSGDGAYTMELLTKTPFGTDRLSYVSFNVARTLAVSSQLGKAQ